LGVAAALANILVWKIAKQVGDPHIVMPAKSGIQVHDFSGFRVAPAIAGLPGMTDELRSELVDCYSRTITQGPCCT